MTRTMLTAAATVVMAGCTVANDGSFGGSAGKFAPATTEQAAAAKAAVTAVLKDPESARFGAITTDGKIVCGSVNAKNSFGGYVGPKVFAIDAGAVHMQGSSAAWSFYGCPGSWAL
jgi:hypothetical protein